MICTFFGHREAPANVEPILKQILIDLIENKQVNKFYVGNQGTFDRIVRKNLKIFKAEYPHIHYAVVLAYMPGKKYDVDYGDTIFPDGLERVHPKYAIEKRNRWLIDNSDVVVTYVTHSFGGAAKFKKIAERRGKYIINICI